MTNISTSTPSEITPSAALPVLAIEHSEPGIGSDALRALFRDHPAGVAVITAEGPSGPVAMTASSLFSVSVAPPLMVFSASAMSSSTPALLAADTLVVHLIDSRSHDIAVLGATSGINRFADQDAWDRLSTGEPYFKRPARRIRTRVVNRLDVGAATLFVVHAIEAWHDDDAVPVEPLVYHNRTWHVLSEQSRLS